MIVVNKIKVMIFIKLNFSIKKQMDEDLQMANKIIEKEIGTQRYKINNSIDKIKKKNV